MNEKYKLFLAILIILNTFILAVALIFFSVPKDSVNLIEAIVLAWTGISTAIGWHYFTSKKQEKSQDLDNDLE